MSFIGSTRISAELLQAVGANQSNAKLYALLLEEARIVPNDAFNTITSRNGIAMLVAQLAHESGNFTSLGENLNYSIDTLRSGNRANYFTPEQARQYGYIRNMANVYVQRADQKMIAKLYYGGRLGNKGINTEDGWTFRGGGLIQLTGRTNFTLFGSSIGKSAEEAADYSRTPEGAVASALWYWRKNGLVVPASKGDVTQCTKLIQGADGGLASREALYKAALIALG